MQYNKNLNEVLTLSTDKRVAYWSIDDQQMIKQLQAGFGVDVN